MVLQKFKLSFKIGIDQVVKLQKTYNTGLSDFIIVIKYLNSLTMVVNQNGLDVDTFKVIKYHKSMNEGQIVGIALGWIFGVTALYLLGLFLIWKLCKNAGGQEESKVSNSMQQKQGQKTRGQTNMKRHRKQIFQDNPTLQMVNVTDSNQIDSHDINLNFKKHLYKDKQYFQQQMQRQQEDQQQQKNQQ